MFGLTVVTPPATEPITLDEAKENLRFSGDYEQGRINSLIKAARIYCETVTGKAFVTQTLRLTVDCFPGHGMYRGNWDDYPYVYSGGIFRLPKPPLQSVTNIQYTAINGTTQMVSSSTYIVDATCIPGRVSVKWGQIWPFDVALDIASVTVNYVAGYGAASAVPDTIKQAMHLLIGHWFSNREAVGNVGGAVELAVSSLLGSESAGVLAGTYA